MLKDTKQYPGLGACRSRDFDTQITDCARAFITHTVLTLHKRFGDYETMGDLFR
ncbi:MAG: hypothetical protein LBB84_05280 [Tannerellaceae bacterium]|nr:hypothetical protein [Tannerellaceae bacterium]